MTWNRPNCRRRSLIGSAPRLPDLPPNQIYKWQAILFENAPTVFQQAGTRAKGEAAAGEEKLARLEAKLQQKNEVIAELMQDHVELQKAVGEP